MGRVFQWDQFFLLVEIIGKHIILTLWPLSKPNQTKANTCSDVIEQAFDFECPFECPKKWCFGNPLPFWVCERGEYSSPVSRFELRIIREDGPFSVQCPQTQCFQRFAGFLMIDPSQKIFQVKQENTRGRASDPSRNLILLVETQYSCGFQPFA